MVGFETMKMEIKHNECVSGEVLAFLSVTAEKHDPEYMDCERLSACSAMTLRDGGRLVMAAAYEIHQRPHGKELEILMVNAERKSTLKWLEPLKGAFLQLAEAENCNRIVVSVARPALERALNGLNFKPLSTFMSLGVL
jgi:hypothetical protein